MKNQKSLTHYFEKAFKSDWALGAFNASDLGGIFANMRAAKKKNSPVILEFSNGEVSFIGRELMNHMIRGIKDQFPSVPVYFNLDHAGKGREDEYEKVLEEIKLAVDGGFDLVHFDGSRLDFDKNIKRTKEVVDYAHKKETLVEGELGILPGSSAVQEGSAGEVDKDKFTDPERAQEFVEKTGCDILAVSIGNIHGVFKGSKENPHLNLERMKELKEKVPVYFSLHGGSGTPNEDIKEALKEGMVKVNVNTELRLSYMSGLKKVLDKKFLADKGTGEIAPYKFFPYAITKMQGVVENKIDLFGSEGKIDN